MLGTNILGMCEIIHCDSWSLCPIYWAAFRVGQMFNKDVIQGLDSVL